MAQPNLFQHQKDLLKADPARTILVWETGTGKTRTSIEWAKQKGLPTLIIFPKALRTNWEREVKKWGLNVKTKLMTKEEFRRDWDKIEDYGTVIIDEAHYFLGTKSQMSKSLLKYCKKWQMPSNIMGLSATPYMSSPMNIYMLGKILGYSGYEWSYPYFMQEFFNIVPMGMRSVPVIRKDADKKIAKIVNKIGSVVRMKDCIDVPNDNYPVEYFKLTKEQEKRIENLQEINFIVRWTKTHQICGGTLKGDDYNPSETFRSDKLDRLLEIAHANEKIIIVCRYNHEIDHIAALLRQGNKKTFIINGDVKDKQAVLDLANKESDCALVVNAACSEGWEAPTFSMMVFYSYDFSLKNYVQMKGRIQRINAIQKCTYLSLVVEDTIDEDVFENVVGKKQSFHLKIYEEQQRSI